MRSLTTALLLLWTAGGLAGELPITERLVQKTSRQLSTHIGGQVFLVKRTSPLPNAFGKADIFGRKVDRGRMELRYKGLVEGTVARFQLKDIETTSNETTVSRARISILSGQARHTVNPYLGGSTTALSGLVIRGPEGRTDDLPADTTEFDLDVTKIPEIEFGSVKLVVEEVHPTKIIYRLENI